MALTSCQGMANPLDGANRMIQAMGRTVGVVSDASKTDPLRLDAAGLERAREDELQGGASALPGQAPNAGADRSDFRFAFSD
jgi:hypothetical protein